MCIITSQYSFDNKTTCLIRSRRPFKMRKLLSNQQFNTTRSRCDRKSRAIGLPVLLTIVCVLLISEGGNGFSVSLYQRATTVVHEGKNYLSSPRSSHVNWLKRLETFDEFIPASELDIDCSASDMPFGNDLALERTSLESVNKTKEKNELRIHNNEKNTMLALLWIIAFLSALDRVAMSVALVPMSEEFQFTDTVKGLISSLFSLGYGVGIIPAGLLVANASPTIVLATGIALWSLATLVTPVASQLLVVSVTATMAPLLIARACVGAGESLILPTAQRILTIWTNADQKGFAIAFVFSGFKTGTVAAYLLSPIVMDTMGSWRALFYTYGSVGFLVMFLWLALARDMPTYPGQAKFPRTMTTTAASESLLADADENRLTKTSYFDDSLQLFKDAPWQDILRSKGAWAMLLAHSAKNWGLYNTLSWTPTFYAEQYGIGVRESAILSVLPSIAGIVGGFIAGISVDTILRRIQSSNGDILDDQKTLVRKYFQGFSLYGAAIALGSLALSIPDEPWVAQTFLTAAVGMQAFGAAGFEAGNQDKAGEKWAGLLYSVTSLPAVMFGTLGVWVTGQILDSTHQDWSYVFGVTAGINILGATAFVLLFDSKREFA